METKESKHKKRIEKIKDAHISFWRLPVSIVVFVAGFFSFFFLAEKIKNPWDLVAFFFLFFQALAVVVGVVRGDIPFKAGPIINHFLWYVFSTFLQLLLIILILPTILIEMILFQFMIVVSLVGFACLVVYFIEIILGIDIKGVVVPFNNGTQVLLTLGAVIVSSFIVYKNSWVKRFIDAWVDKATDLIVFLETGRKNDSPQNTPKDTK